MEGLSCVLAGPRALVLGAIVLLILVGVVFAAWRRPPMRLWAALFLAQSVFLLVTPSFFGHYGGWVAPASLSVGGAIAVAMGVEGSVTRRSASVAGLYAAGLAGLLIVAVAPKARRVPEPQHPVRRKAMVVDHRGRPLPNRRQPHRPDPDGRAPPRARQRLSAVISPTGLAYDLDHDLRSSRPREDRPEFQAAMRAYFGGSDAAIFIRPPGQRRPVRRDLGGDPRQPPGRAAPRTGHGAPPGAVIPRRCPKQPVAPGAVRTPASSRTSSPSRDARSAQADALLLRRRRGA